MLQYRALAAILMVSSFQLVRCLEQSDLDYMAEYIGVRYGVISNVVYGHKYYQAKITLTNTGKHPIVNVDWAIYFCHIAKIENTANDPLYDTDVYGVKISHVNGCLMKIEPINDNFPRLQPNTSHTIRFIAKYFLASRCYVMPNWYLTSSSLEPRTLNSSRGESLKFVDDFDTPAKWKRSSDDKFSPFTARQQFNLNMVDETTYIGIFGVIPRPLNFTLISTDMIDMYEQWDIVLDQQSMVLKRSADFISESFSSRFPVKQQPGQNRYIRFFLGEPLGLKQQKGRFVKSEAYSLKIARDMISITALTNSGAFYAVQTLLSLSFVTGQVRFCEIIDAPRFQYRGMHLDVVRNFVPKNEVKRLIDTMAMYKLNRLHLHLSDDEGWRLEIPGLEHLTQVGSNRCHDPLEVKCLLPQLGSGPTNQTLGSGFFTTSDYRELLTHAARLNIQVIPEFDMPGHCRAAVKSMQARHEDMKNHPGYIDYRLTEADDASEYESVQMFTDNAVNPCLESTYSFMQKVVDELVRLHNNTNPLERFHFGGDEVPKGAWLQSKSCKLMFARPNNISNITDLKYYFAKRVKSIIVKHGLHLAAWEDGVSVKWDSDFVRNVLVYSWNNIWEWGRAKRAYEYANAGYKIVMAQATHLYFDHPQEPDPEERGLFWATRVTNTEKVFSFTPYDLYSLANTTRYGYPLTQKQLCGGPNGCTKLKKPDNIVGMQGQLWTETVRTPAQMHSMIYPRLLALAERAWHRADWEDVVDSTSHASKKRSDWARFSNIVNKKELLRLSKLGVMYYVPRPGATISDGKLVANVLFSDLKIEYSTNGGVTWTVYTRPTQVVTASTILLRTRAHGDRLSRLTILSPTTPTTTPTSAAIIKALPIFSLCATVLILITCTIDW